jgi:hypothetical protein
MTREAGRSHERGTKPRDRLGIHLAEERKAWKTDPLVSALSLGALRHPQMPGHLQSFLQAAGSKPFCKGRFQAQNLIATCHFAAES